MADLPEYIAQLRAAGKDHFSLVEAAQSVPLSLTRIEAAAERAVARGEIARLARGFYLVLNRHAAPDPLRWIDALMKFLGVRCRVSLQHTAATQEAQDAPQTFYLVVPKRLAAIQLENCRIHFLYLAPQLFEQTNRPEWLVKTSGSGDCVEAGPELTLVDAVLFSSHPFARPRIGSLLAELGGRVDPSQLAEVASVCTPVVIRRLARLLLQSGHEKQARAALNRLTATGKKPKAGEPESPVASEVKQLRADFEAVRRGVEDRAVFLSGELSALHNLVVSQLTNQIETLHRQAYDLKRRLYHSEISLSTTAFNGQFSKHRIFSALHKAFEFDAFVETGAYLGRTTEFLASFGKPVYSVECNPEFHGRARSLIGAHPLVHLTLGNSTEFLDNLDLPPDALIFFYLDAHWHDSLPLADELRIIARRYPHAVVLVDDFKVENDDGYGFDTYGGGQDITLEFLKPILRESRWNVFFPSLAAEMDHNSVDILLPRGTAVLACHNQVLEALHGITDLRYFPS